MSPHRMVLLLFWVAFGAPGAHVACGQDAPVSEGYIVTSDNARLFYRVVGRGPDTLIAIHGGPGVDLESIAADFGPLAARHVVIFYDQRGGGRSDLPADTIRLLSSRQIADLDEVRRHFGLARVTLIAHSYGPLLAASYALAHPQNVRRMVLIGPVPPYRGDFWERFGANVGPHFDSTALARLDEAGRRIADPAADTRAACREFWAIALRPRLADPTRTQELIRGDLCAADPAAIRYGFTITGRVVMASYGDWDLRNRLRELNVPTLVIHGEQEAIPMDMVEQWVTSLPHAELLRVPHAAHFPYVEQPAIVWPAIERFLGSTLSDLLPDPVLDACEIAQRVAREVLSLEARLEKDVEVVNDFAPDPADPRRGCRITGHDDRDRVAAPVDDLREALQRSGWQPQLEYMADGPDGSLVGMIVGPALCIIEGRWDGGDDSDTTYVPVPGYDLEVRCFRRTPADVRR